MSKTLYMVVPCYNEQEVLPETSKRLLEKLQSLVLKNKIADNSRIMFVNDGSKDSLRQTQSFPHIIPLSYSMSDLSNHRLQT